MTKVRSKLDLRGERVSVTADMAIARVSDIFRAVGCSDRVALQVAEHLADTSLCGIESHGLMRTLQYVDQIQSGHIDPKAIPRIQLTETGAQEIDGGGGIGIPAMQLAFYHGMSMARTTGISALAVRNVGHTGRHGAYADRAAEAGFLTFLTGGGNRQTWRQVAPYGGAKAVLPTNPWCIGIPGGKNGSVVADFATSMIAGGWIYAARSAGALLPEGAVIDRMGRPTRDPEDYFDGGALLPFGGHKGYALALMAELIGEAMLGPVATECNWLLITLDTERFRARHRLQDVAEEILEELRTCPPADGFERVEIPGEREREYRAASAGLIAVPMATWAQILELSRALGVG